MRIAKIGIPLFLMLPSSALAYDWSAIGRVTFVEPTYAPGPLPFRIDSGERNCPAGTTIIWNSQGADEALKIAKYNALLATLLTAKSTG